MAVEIPTLSVLLLAEGYPSPRYLLPFPDGRPSYQHNLELLNAAFPEAEDICISQPDTSPLFATQTSEELSFKIVHGSSVLVPNSTNYPGPAQAILAAYRSNPASHWLVIPSDMPLLTTAELRHLRQQYREPVTCFESSSVLVPLVSIWSPRALTRLEETLADGYPDVGAVFAEMGGFRTAPLYDHSLFNVKTEKDWNDAMRLLARKK